MLEETPAPSIDDAKRRALADAAVALARAAGYVNAGTVEFALDERDDFFFLEVNARLQVEHPVTEMVWDIDLVEQQLRVAQGERLLLKEPAPRGHAIEVRLYAEDVAAGFLPATGRLLHLRLPDGIRVDAGYDEGNEVTRHYDPLIAKLIAHGPHRKLALAKLEAALAQTEVLGVRTNLGFLRALAAHPDVQRGRVDTELVAREFERLSVENAPASTEAIALAAVVVADAARGTADPWTAHGAFRIGEPASTAIVLHEGAREHAVRVQGTGPYEAGAHRIARARGERHAWTVDGAPAAAALGASSAWVTVTGHATELSTVPPERATDAAAASEVVAPMPGLVIGASARADAQVRRGELLFVVEAMKMELRVEAPADGVVRRVLASVGQQVERGQRLAEFDPS